MLGVSLCVMIFLGQMVGLLVAVLRMLQLLMTPVLLPEAIRPEVILEVEEVRQVPLRRPTSPRAWRTP